MDIIPEIHLLRQLPDVDDLLENASLKYYIEAYSRERVAEKLDAVLASIKEDIKQGKIESIDTNEIIFEAINQVSKEFKRSLKPVINATGVVLSQYLGRAPLSKEVISNMVNTSVGYCNLDFDLNKGTNTSRFEHLKKLISQITGAESAIVVNNNAAALMLIANTFGKNKEIIISRGEILEIEDEFRLQDAIKAGGSKLVEVGTTNRSHLKDYAEAISDKTSMILKVHSSSYYIKGYTSKVELFAIVDLAKSRNLISVIDLGTGLFIDLNKYGLPYEPTVNQTIKTDVDLVTLSGDKLLGGPQAGIILGKKSFIEAIAKNPLLRALRPDKLTLSALEATLQLYLNPEKPVETIPTLMMLTKKINLIESEANLILKDLKNLYSIDCGVKKYFSDVGGSILPEVKLPTYIVWIKHKNIDACTLHQRFLDNAVVTKIKDETIIIDPRCLLKRDFKMLGMIFEQVLK